MRSGLSEDYADEDPLAAGRWRAAVRSALYGKRGQAFLRDLAAHMDAMPVRELYANVWDEPQGPVCALGVVTRARGIDTSMHDPEDDQGAEIVAEALNIAPAMARTIVWENDDTYSRNVVGAHGQTYWLNGHEDPAQRWQRMRRWVEDKIKSQE
jgi:hypothetical protein